MGVDDEDVSVHCRYSGISSYRGRWADKVPRYNSHSVGTGTKLLIPEQSQSLLILLGLIILKRNDPTKIPSIIIINKYIKLMSTHVASEAGDAVHINPTPSSPP